MNPMPPTLPMRLKHRIIPMAARRGFASPMGGYYKTQFACGTNVMSQPVFKIQAGNRANYNFENHVYWSTVDLLGQFAVAPGSHKGVEDIHILRIKSIRNSALGLGLYKQFRRSYITDSRKGSLFEWRQSCDLPCIHWYFGMQRPLLISYASLSEMPGIVDFGNRSSPSKKV